MEAVEEFVVTFDPPLLPALQGSTFETQISLADDPPDYDRANRVLKVSTYMLDDPDASGCIMWYVRVLQHCQWSKVSVTYP